MLQKTAFFIKIELSFSFAYSLRISLLFLLQTYTQDEYAYLAILRV
jgi:hypothetical protein